MRYVMVVVLLLAVACSAIAGNWNAFVIRNSTTGNIPPVITDDGLGGKIFAITLGGQKAGWGTNLLNGKTVGSIYAISIVRDSSVIGWGPYLNIWVKDINGNYAVLGNEPSNLGEYTNPGGAYNLTWDVLKNCTAMVYETNGMPFVLPAKSGGDHYHFSDFANYVIATPSSHWGGGGAPDVLGADPYTAYGINWIFGDTQSNYVGGYQVSSPVVSTPTWYTIRFSGLDLFKYSSNVAARASQIAPRRVRDWTDDTINFSFESYLDANLNGTNDFAEWAGSNLASFGFANFNLYGDTIAPTSWDQPYHAVPDLGDGFFGVASWRNQTVNGVPVVNSLGDPISWAGGIVQANQPYNSTNYAYPVWRAPLGTQLTLANAANYTFSVDVLIENSGSAFEPDGNLRVWFGGFNTAAESGPAQEMSGIVQLPINQLSLDPTPASIYLKPGETALINMNVAGLQQPVTGVQAMLNFSSTYFSTAAGDVTVAAGGGDWDQLIYSTWRTSGDMDVAVGVKLEPALAGTIADATTARISLKAIQEGVTKVVFRPDASPDPGLVQSTFLSDTNSQPVWPNKIDSVNIYIDGTKPVVAITDPASGYQTSAASVTVSGTVSDSGTGASGVASVTVNGIAATITGGTWTAVVPIAAGPNTITATAVDNAGNDQTASIDVLRDVTSPDVAITSPADGFPTNADTVEVSGTASDTGADASGLKSVTVNGVAAAITGGTWTAVVPLVAGSNTITATAEDNVGNTKSASITVLQDKTLPTIAITSPADGYKTNASSVAVSGTVSDPAPNASSIKSVTVNGVAAAVTGGTWTVTVPVIEGTNTITATATDNAGNTKAASISVLRDTVAPTISIADNFGTDPVVQGVYTVTVTASDPASGLAGAPVMDWGGLSASAGVEDPAGTWTYTVTIDAATANGTHTITADISDQAGTPAAQAKRVIVVNKNQVTGLVQLEAYTGSSRVVTFVATGGSISKTWSLTLTGWTAGVANYVLSDVPEGTTAISAKTAWTLREKLSVTLVGGQASANFIGDGVSGWSDATDHYLRGGDLDGSNSVNVLDYSIMKLNWTVSPALADPNKVGNIDGDNVVNTSDYNIMKGNWFKVGDGV